MSEPRIALAGTGHWGRNWARNFYELGELRWLVDSDPARLAEMSAKYPGVKTATRIEDALEDDGVRGVVAATPAITHADVARTVLEAGRDVLCEKPLALSVADAEPLAALAK
jgi:UDP-2-acetamido-3-amino-2,3-dideoxy-glucuronate N-acetyltransferase